jgi:hypothetical protein
MDHDFAAQRKDTQNTFAEMQAEHDLPEEADVDYFFLPAEEGADWRALAEALSQEGFDCEWVEDDEGEPPYLVATLPDQFVSASGIWIGEETATRIALAHGFTPDGWGLLGEGEDDED